MNRLMLKVKQRFGAVCLARNKSRATKDIEMLGNGGLGETKAGAEIVTTTAITLCQLMYHRQTHRMPQRLQAFGKQMVRCGFAIQRTGGICSFFCGQVSTGHIY